MLRIVAIIVATVLIACGSSQVLPTPDSDTTSPPPSPVADEPWRIELREAVRQHLEAMYSADLEWRISELERRLDAHDSSWGGIYGTKDIHHTHEWDPYSGQVRDHSHSGYASEYHTHDRGW